LANSGNIAVFPVNGLWREAKGNQSTKQVQYALIVTIRSEELKVDLLTPLATEVELYARVKTAIIVTVQPAAVSNVEIADASIGDLKWNQPGVNALGAKSGWAG